MFPFSFVLIARNECETLPRLLNSIKYFLDKGGEVVIVDTGSTDNTAQIARDLGCKVYEVGDRFKIKIDEEYARKINERFVINGEPPVVNAGDSLFDFASARNYAGSVASNNWIWMPDADEIFTKLNYEEVIKAMNEPFVDRLCYDFIFAHDQF